MLIAGRRALGLGLVCRAGLCCLVAVHAECYSRKHRNLLDRFKVADAEVSLASLLSFLVEFLGAPQTARYFHSGERGSLFTGLNVAL